MSINHAITSTSTGYHTLSRRQVGLTIDSGALRLHENGQVVTLTRATAQPIEWVGIRSNAPMFPLPGLVLDGPGGPWIVASIDSTVVLGDWVEQATPAPHVFVSGEDLASMATACGIEVTRREAWVPPPTSTKSIVLMVGGLIAVVALFITMGKIFGPTKPRSTDSCTNQRAPVEELYPRLSCQDARAELDRVARGEATPRAIVLRAESVIVDARDTKGPATITCDGIVFDVIDAMQSADGPINVGGVGGLTSVLVEEQADGTLRPSQYCGCCNVVGRERKGPRP
jgi:hypothetical protein